MATVELKKTDSEKSESRVTSKNSSQTLKALVVDSLIPALQSKPLSQSDMLSLYQSILAQVQHTQHVLINPDSAPEMMGVLNQFRLNLSRALVMPAKDLTPENQDKALISRAYENFKDAGKEEILTTTHKHKKHSRRVIS